MKSTRLPGMTKQRDNKDQVSDRLARQLAARQAVQEKFRARQAEASTPEAVAAREARAVAAAEREARQAERKAIRDAQAKAKAEADAREAGERAQREAAAKLEAEAEAERQKIEQKARRDARYAARKARK